jgi:hypothetical protein
MKRILILAGMGLALLAPLACVKTIGVNPVIPIIPTPTPTFTPACPAAPIPASPLPAGIAYQGEIDNLVYNGTPQFAATLWIAVNGVPESTDSVSLLGPGANLPLAYQVPATQYGNIYADYSLNASSGLTPGSVYTLDANTSLGMASASVTLPTAPSIAVDGSSVTWPGPSLSDGVTVEVPALQTFATPSCGISTITIPGSAYPAHGSFLVAAESRNFTTSITGGTGVLVGIEKVDLTVVK